MINRIVPLVLMVATIVAVIASTGAQPEVTVRAQQQTGSPLTGPGRFEKTRKWKGDFTLKGSGGGQHNDTRSRWTVNQSATGTFELERVADNLWQGNYEAFVTVDDSVTGIIEGKEVTSHYQGSGTVRGVWFLSIDNSNGCVYDLGRSTAVLLPVTVTIGGNSSLTNYTWGPNISLGIERIAVPTSGKILSERRQFRRHAQVGESDWDITWSAECDTDGDLNVGALRQNDPEWRSDLYDHSPTKTIWSKGCALTSLAMAINFLGPGGTGILIYTPRTLNQVMTGAGGFVGPNIVFPVATNKATFGSAKFHAVESNSTSGLDEILCMGFPVIVGVKLNGKGTPGHYVIVTGKQGNEYLINDPAFNPVVSNNKTKLSDYGTFKIRGFVTDAEWNGPTKCGAAAAESNLAADTGAGKDTLTISANVELLVVDPNGKRTGYDPSAIDGRLDEIPESVYFRDALEDDQTGAPPDEVNHMVHIEHPAEGTYQITVIGLQAGPFSVTIDPFSQDGSPQTPTIVQGTIPVGSSSFQFQYSSTPGSTPTPTPTPQAELRAWTQSGTTFGYVKLIFPDPSYHVTTWGSVSSSGHDFSANAAIDQVGGTAVQTQTSTAQIYQLGTLAAGDYTFTFKNSGVTLNSLNFTVGGAVQPNPTDDQRTFVRRQYLDFLGREPDGPGWDHWTNNITKCNDPQQRPAGQTLEQCIDQQRVTTSGAFFLSPEFQYTGYYVYRFYKGALGRVPYLSEFTPDQAFVGNGIIVNNQLSASVIEQNKRAYANQFVQRADFKASYDALSNQQYVDKLFETTGVNASAQDRTTLVNGLNNSSETRAGVLQKVVDGAVVIAEGNQRFDTTYGKAFYDKEFNAAFVLMEYFGYMRRDPDAPGYAFWLGKLNFYGNYIDAEMVRSFIISPEYRSRFGQP